jgi:tetratricopeptide (TPR) repeat protein
MLIDKAQDRSERAREFLENGQYMEAASAFISLGEYASAARAFSCAKNYNEAAQCYEKANKPLDAARLYLLLKNWGKAAELFSLAGDEMRAEVAREQMRKEAPQQPETASAAQPKEAPKEQAIWPKGDIWNALRGGDMNLAVNLYLKPGATSGWELLQERKSTEALSSLAEMLFMARDYAVAADAFRQLKDDKKTANCLGLAGLYEEAADFYVMCGERNLAAQHLEKAHQWSRAADIHCEDGRFIEAARCYEKLNEPVKAAGMYLKAGKPDLALPLLQSIPPNHQHFAQCRLLAGKILFQKGQRDLALSLLAPLSEFKTIDDAAFDILYQLAGLMEFGSEHAKAREIYLKIQQNRFGYKDVEKKLDLLKNVGAKQQPPVMVKPPEQKTAPDVNVDTSPLRDCSLLDKLDLNDLRRLWMSGTILEPKPGDILLNKGESSNGLFIILSGGLSITSDPTNPKLAVGFLGRGDYVGLGALIQGPPQPNTLVAQKDTHILFLPKNELEHLISTEVELGLRLFRSIAESLAQTMMKITQQQGK